MRLCRYLSSRADLPACFLDPISHLVWSRRRFVTEVDQEGSGMMMTGHSLGSHGLEQAELSFHLARDTVRYTEEHKICEWISHLIISTLDWFNGESNVLRSAFPAVKIDDSHSLNWSSLILFLDVPSQTNYVTWSYYDVSFLSWLNTSLKQSCERSTTSIA